DRAHDRIGVAGEPATPGALRPINGSPMPPLPGHAGTGLLRAGAASLGYETFAPPLLINSVPRAGRPACLGCGACVGMVCPNDSRNGTHNTSLARAAASGRCRIETGAVAERIETDGRGRASAVHWRRRDGVRM